MRRCALAAPAVAAGLLLAAALPVAACAGLARLAPERFRPSSIASFIEETGIPRAYRDARLQRIGGGTDEIMNEIIAKRLGLGPASRD